MSPNKQYWVFTREGIELTALATFDDREDALAYMKTLPPGVYSLASFIIIDATIRLPERNRPAHVLEGGTRFITRPRKGSSKKKGAR